ncbi:MAG: hypothetical protein AB1758_36080 [Candidatus Eremiobacterota bacterium]
MRVTSGLHPWSIGTSSIPLPAKPSGQLLLTWIIARRRTGGYHAGVSNQKLFLGSLARIADFVPPLNVEPLAREHWQTGDYVVGEVLTTGPYARVELDTGRLIDVIRGDRVLGALGHRAATLEVVGDWQRVGQEGVMDLMTPAGLMGKITSQSPYLGPLPTLEYKGHVIVQGSKASMRDFVGDVPAHPLGLPVVLLIGTSMSAGKTTTARVMVRLLKEMGLRVVGAKLTGAGRYRDILSLHDAGADFIFDFVDVGLPSTVCDPEEFRGAIDQLLSRLSRLEADVLVAEAGSSPLEPYNGAVAMEALGAQVRMLVLCASDPYAALGVMVAFGQVPHLISGVAANTSAGIRLTESLTKVRTLSIMEEDSLPYVRQLLKERLALAERAG